MGGSSLLPLFTLFLLCSSTEGRNYLLRGESLSVEASSHILKSPNGNFSCGFYNISKTAFIFSIWFSNSADKTVVWTANPNRPVHGTRSIIEFSKHGDLIVKDYGGQITWKTPNYNGPYEPFQAELRNSGNLVITSRGNNILWQSFDHPTNTLLANQPLNPNTQLVSDSNISGSSSYNYKLYFAEFSNTLSLKYTNPNVSSIYWPNPDFSIWTPFNSKNGSFDENGVFTSNGDKFEASDLGLGVLRRLTLDPDGNLKLYSLNELDGSWYVSWEAMKHSCKIHGFCGQYGICKYLPKPICTCPPGFTMIDPSNWSKGCKPNFKVSSVENYNSKKVWFLHLPYSDYGPSNVETLTQNITLRKCKEICKNISMCQGFEFRPNGDCYTKELLFNGRFYQGYLGDIYLKIPASVKASELVTPKVQPLACKNIEPQIELKNQEHVDKKMTIWVYLYAIVIVIFAIEAFFISFGYFFIFRSDYKPLESEEGYKVISGQFRRFTYEELEEATGKFKDVIGTGGSGVVYKGVLKDGRVIAAKILQEVTQGGQEFEAELSVIARIYHMNLVRVWGFCYERSHRILVCEYVENGSLDKALFGPESGRLLVNWEQRYKIALGVAKGLAYLHHECLEWVIHCDVKPENILLDLDYEPKITDFGLAKLLHRGGANSKMSQIRGTRGYIAPEWTSSLPITVKVDVYSYGVLLLELLMGVRVSDWVLDNGDEVKVALRSLIMMLKEKLEVDEANSWVGDIVHARLNGQFNFSQVTICVKLAISCLEEERSKRPSMESVVQALNSYDFQANSKRIS